jgi:uncharacterized membrane protein
MMPHLTLTGAIHSALALLCIAIGFVQLLRPKRGAGHRARGYAFVYAMLVADSTALSVYQFTGKFNVLHAGAIANLICVVAAVIPLLRSPRPVNWKLQHYYWIAWSYVGLIAAAATELVVRLSLPATPERAWVMTSVMTIAVTVIGYILVEKNRPGPESGTVAANAIQHDGASS